MRYEVRQIEPRSYFGGPAYTHAVLDTRRTKYVRYCSSQTDANRIAAELNQPKKRTRK